MSTEAIVLAGVEAQLLEVAFLERKRATDEANALFAQRTLAIRQAHGVSDGMRVDFALDGGDALMRITDE